MGLNYVNLDKETREQMLAEIKRDIGANTWYRSTNLTEQGLSQYPDLLRKAAESGNGDTLAIDLHSLMKPKEVARATGTERKMRDNAHEMLGEGQFNNYYMRAVCLRAISSGKGKVTVYRGKAVDEARSSSKALISQQLEAHQALDDLRKPPTQQTMGLSKPNSGISVSL
jgi:hypothetical protein